MWKDGKKQIQFKGQKDQHNFLPEWDIIYNECKLSKLVRKNQLKEEPS